MADPVAAKSSPYLSLATAGLGALTGGAGGAGVEALDQTMSARSPIHIAPVGFNLGAILAPFNSGSPENGGYGIESVSRLLPYQQGGTVTTPLYSSGVMGNTAKLIIVATVTGLGIILIMKRKK